MECTFRAKEGQGRMFQTLQDRLNVRSVLGVLTFRWEGIGDHGDNARVEQTVHRLRQHAMVILQGVEQKIGHSIPVSHPLAS